MTAPRRLIINADDFGLSAAVNRGILEAHAAGTVTSTSLLANAPGFEDAVRSARDAPGLGIGLHLNLTEGQVVSPPETVSSLCAARTGRLRGLAGLVTRVLSGRVRAEHVAAECTAQIERLRQRGVPITHLDGHHHAHVLPGVWGPALGAARAAGITAVRVPLEPLGSLTWRPAAALGEAGIVVSYRLASRKTPPLRHPDHFRGFALTGRRDFLPRLVDILDALEPGVTELMVHPGYWDARVGDWGGPLTQERERELAALTSDAVRSRLRGAGVQLIHFGAL
jgi:chitin disaccharide deacetylase